ncbi:Protein FAR1-RELATED SEQUENCE [Arachis hypogaea]|nr:Protein FAR1-RELATED SEQUENCE [Arachis hypogaea]
MSINEDDVKNDSDNDLGNNFDYQPNAEDDAEDDDVDSLDSTSKSEEVCGVKRIADLMVEDIWNLEFRTEDEACQFYNAYSCWHGFVMRKDDVVRNNQGRIISRQLVCNKEGWRNMRWKVSCFIESHNHDLTPPQFAHLVPANRRLTVTDKKDGYRHAGFIRKDLYNHIDRYRQSKVKNRDANAAINYLIDKSNNDPLFFGKYTFTSDERLEHIFWADGQSIIDYHCFGYIVAFDSTYKKNKYNKPLVIFSGCNHHGQTVIFGSGLLSDKTTETYKWLLGTFVEAMGGKSPKAVITDGDLAMALKEYRNNELIADFKSRCSEPVMITSLERAGALNIKVLSTTLGKVEFNVTALGDPAKDRRVEVDRSKNLFSCSCKLFESRGIPCSHVLCAMKFENILEFSDSLIYKRWTKNAKNEFFSIEMPVHDDVERVLKFRVGALASNCNKLCDIACKDLADFDEVQFELLNLVIRLQSRKQGKSTPNVNVEGINDPFVVKSKGAPSKRSSWRKKRACFNCHKYGHYYKRCPDLMQHSVQGNPRNRSDGNASAKDSGFSPERFANSSRSFSVKSEHHSGPKTKPFKKGGTRKFTAKGMRNQKGKDNTFDENDVQDSLPSSIPCGNKQGSYMALFASMHRTL